MFAAPLKRTHNTKKLVTAQHLHSKLCLLDHELQLPKYLNPWALTPKILKAQRLPRKRYFKSTFLRVHGRLYGENSWAKGQVAQGGNMEESEMN